jgi:hypothetical protein
LNSLDGKWCLSKHSHRLNFIPNLISICHLFLYSNLQHFWQSSFAFFFAGFYKSSEHVWTLTPVHKPPVHDDGWLWHEVSYSAKVRFQCQVIWSLSFILNYKLYLRSVYERVKQLFHPFFFSINTAGLLWRDV